MEGSPGVSCPILLGCTAALPLPPQVHASDSLACLTCAAHSCTCMHTTKICVAISIQTMGDQVCLGGGEGRKDAASVQGLVTSGLPTVFISHCSFKRAFPTHVPCTASNYIDICACRLEPTEQGCFLSPPPKTVVCL